MEILEKALYLSPLIFSAIAVYFLGNEIFLAFVPASCYTWGVKLLNLVVNVGLAAYLTNWSRERGGIAFWNSFYLFPFHFVFALAALTVFAFILSLLFGKWIFSF